MNVKLIRHTLSPDELVALGARLCYSKSDLAKLEERIQSTDQAAFVDKVMSMGHDSVLEHASFTFLVEGVSRVLLAQLTRHRMASYSVQSQRYCGVKLEYVTPPKIQQSGWKLAYQMHCERSFTIYQGMVQDGIPEEDARYVIPQGFNCRLLVTMNVRELRHFFSLRCCTRAQWEIRNLAKAMLEECRRVAPALFADAGPGCVRGRCPEGEKSCGKPWRSSCADRPD